jgi:hypothetical protein
VTLAPIPSSKLQLKQEKFHEIPKCWTLTSLVSSDSSQKKEKMKKKLTTGEHSSKCGTE